VPSTARQIVASQIVLVILSPGCKAQCSVGIELGG
jgi:hypothetical protein